MDERAQGDRTCEIVRNAIEHWRAASDNRVLKVRRGVSGLWTGYLGTNLHTGHKAFFDAYHK